LRAGEALGVTLRVDGFAVFVRGKIGNQVDWLAAKFAGYLWRWVALHKRLLYRATPSVDRRGVRGLSNMNHSMNFAKAECPFSR
jgi:hypothetical protein